MATSAGQAGVELAVNLHSGASNPQLIEAELASALTAEEQRYGVSPEVKWTGDRFQGFVVTSEQLKRIAKQLSVPFTVPVLSDESQAGTQAWSQVGEKENIYASPTCDKLANQSLPKDPALRRLKMSAHAGRVLVQSFDRSLGWIRESSLRPASELKISQFSAAQAIEANRSHNCSHNQIIELCQEAISLANQSIPYLLGGSDLNASIDCSALVLRLYYKHLNLLLPRHSSDQRRLGQRVSFGQEQAGDLLFATSQKRRISHVGLIVPAIESRSQVAIVHACLSKGEVVYESLPSFFTTYKRRTARRVWESQ